MVAYVVDSQEAQYRFIKHIISDTAFEVKFINISDESWSESLASNNRDLYFISLDVNVFDGFYYARRIREISMTCDIIFLSNKPNKAMQAYSFVNADFIRLPMNEMVLMDKIQKIIRKRDVKHQRHYSQG